MLSSCAAPPMFANRTCCTLYSTCGLVVRRSVAPHLQDEDGNIDFDEFTAMMTAGNQEILSSKSTLRRQNLAEKVVSMRPQRNSTS